MGGDAIAHEHGGAVKAAAGQLDPEAVEAPAQFLRANLLGAARPGQGDDGVVAVDTAPAPRDLGMRLRTIPLL